MPSMLLRRDDVIVGVDTHKDQHVAVVLDGLGGRLGELFVPATPAGFAELFGFCQGHVGREGRLVGFGVEGTGSYGIGLARFLRRHGHSVHEVHRPARAGERRMSGKSDSIDAEHAARQVLAGSAMAVPKTADGQVEALRLLKIARDSAVKAQTSAMITLKATLVTASDELRAELEPLTDQKLILACSVLISAASLDDNRTRIRSEAAFAKMCGACPIPAGSGKTNGRHRLNRGGNRQANAALYRVVIVRMRWHQPTIDYVTRRTAEGLSKREIIRCLKRFLAREIYHLLPPIDAAATPSINRIDQAA